MTKVKRLGALLLAVCALATSVAPVAFANAGGGPGSNNGCPGHQHRPSRVEAAATNCVVASESPASSLRGRGALLRRSSIPVAVAACSIDGA